MSSFAQDLRYALRGLVQNPGFTLVTVFTLGMAIGAVTPTFTFINAYLLRPLPFAEPNQLVHVWATDQQKEWTTLRVSYPDFRDWREQNQSFQDLAAFNYTSEDLTGGEQSEEVSAARVSANVFDVLGVKAARGRTFAQGEDQPGGSGVAVVSHQFWENRLGSPSRFTGQSLQVDGRSYQIVGVMPQDFVFPLPTTQFWLPRELDEERYTRDEPFLQVVGRLKPGVSAEQASADLNLISERLEREFPDSNAGRGANVVPLRSALNFAHEIFQVMAVILVIANLFVVLIACSNVSGLLLGRAVKRSREVAIRSAIGASRGRLIRQFLVESLVLSLLGGGAGLLMAVWLVELMSRSIPDDLYRVGSLEVDFPSLAFTLGLATVTSLVFGLLPALRLARADVAVSLREAGSGQTASRESLRLQKLLVGAEIAIALMLLVGTSMMVQTFFRLRQVDPGFQSENVLTVRLTLPSSNYATPAVRAQFHDRLRQEVRQLPGVEATATVDYLPLNHEMQLPGYSVPGQAPDTTRKQPTASLLSVGADYFSVLRIPLVSGRFFNDGDQLNAAPVAIVNSTLADRLAGGRASAIDSEIQIEGYARPCRIIGIVGTTKHWDLDEAPRPQIYVHQLQQPRAYFRLLVRGARDPMDLLPSVRSAVASIDPRLPLTEVRSMEQVLSDYLLPQRSVVVVLGLLSVGALLLAGVGVYGLMAFFVSQRRREVGIRMALGAGRGAVIRLVLRRGLPPALAGVGFGLLGALGLTRLVATQLFGAGSSGLASLISMPLVLLALAAFSCYFPARRAAALDPVTTLRHQ